MCAFFPLGFLLRFGSDKQRYWGLLTREMLKDKKRNRIGEKEGKM